MLVVIIMGSPGDAEFAGQVARALAGYDIPSETRVASAHKVPRYLLDALAAWVN
jgi:phosphoribosylcarboxyaminoimidazole (NCAIR) mutase